MQLPLKSIRIRFLGIQVLSILLTVVLLCGVSLYLLADYHRSLQQEKLEAHAQSRAVETEQLLKSLKDELRQLGVACMLSQRPHSRANLEQELRSRLATFPKLSYFSADGHEQIRLLAGQKQSHGVQRSAEEALQQALASPEKTIVSILPVDSDFAVPSLVLTIARHAHENEPPGVLQATLPLSEFAKRFPTRHVQDEVELALVDEHGRVLIHPRETLLFMPIFADSGVFGRLYKAGTIGFAEGELAGRTSYFGHASLDGQSWLSLAILPTSYFQQLLGSLMVYVALLALVGLLLGSLLAHVLGRPILNNIGLIKRQAQFLAEGRLDQRIEIESGDELEDLARAVNTLTDRLVGTRQDRDSLDLILRTVVDPLVISDHKGRIIRTNPAAYALLGGDETELVGQGLSHYFCSSSPLSAPQALQQHFVRGDLRNFETELRTADGRCLPVLLSSAHAREGDVQSFVVSIFRDITEQKEAERKISRLAYYDELTGLPNRTMLRMRLDDLIIQMERFPETRGYFAVLFLDLDHFKLVNDSLGHSVGDQLLQDAAARLRNALRKTDTISRAGQDFVATENDEHMLARLGGDEFILLLPRLRSPDDAVIVAQRIIQDMARPFTLGEHQVVTPASIGLSIYPDDGRDSDTLLRCADLAMYHAKEQGRNSFYFYSEEMNESARERLYLEHRLRRSIEQEKGFRLAYQPKVDLQSNRVCGMEALLRWDHDELGSVSPARFIPIAEESGLIVPLGQWILKTACQQLKSWLDAGGPRIKVAVNLSGRQLKQPDLVQMVATVLHETGLEPELLELELTESMLMETVEKTIELLQRLKKLGVTLAIDDFGTGYSSLSYLKRFPIDTLKIDRSFVRDLEADRDDATIVQAIIAMSRSLGLQVVAEGVETEHQLNFLKDNGAHQFQGFLFSKPVFAEEFAERFL